MRCWNGANCERTISYERTINSYFIFYSACGTSELIGG